MKKILIALDYDPSAQKVAEIGFLFGKAMKAEITLLHVMADPISYKITEHVKIIEFAGRMDTNKEYIGKNG